MQQLDLLTTPRARRSDPSTSHDAAESARELATRHHGIILDVLRNIGPLGKDGISQWGCLNSVQVARRLPDLQRMGKIALTGRTVTSNSGRAEREWRAI